ncbi:hypothetical protein SALBM217S_09389 [Streptomyces griseoloalbus]
MLPGRLSLAAGARESGRPRGANGRDRLADPDDGSEAAPDIPATTVPTEVLLGAAAFRCSGRSKSTGGTEQFKCTTC